MTPGEPNEPDEPYNAADTPPPSLALADVRRLRLDPGDALVLRLGPGGLPGEVAQDVMGWLREHFSGNPVLVIPHDADVSVVMAEEQQGLQGV